MVWRWVVSSTVRQAAEFCRRVRIVLEEQRDQLTPDAICHATESLERLRARIREGASSSELKEQMTQLEKTANQWLHPYPNPAVRENVKEVLVALTIILSITTFFIQLTKIPTGSLQPTLFGITYHNLLAEAPTFEIPGFCSRFYQYWVHGISYYEVVAPADGLLKVEAPQKIFPFVSRQRVTIDDASQYVWFPPDDLFQKSNVFGGRYCHRGEILLKMKVIAGDHLLVDRFTYNFRHPRRGEIFVFKTRGIPRLGQDVLYIKRLVALGGEHVRILNDQHLEINGQRLDASTPHFENVYTFDRDKPMPSHYFGHVNGVVAANVGHPNLAPLFPDEQSVYTIPKGTYLAMGDNTLDSYDSRAWGPVPQENVTGKAFFVYWPISPRFGWGTR